MSLNNKPRAIGYLLAAIAFATSQDAIVKAMSGGYPTWEAVAFRGAAAIPPFLIWGAVARLNLFVLPAAWKLILLRSVILFSAYMAFALSIATLPLANAVAIYFTMPFFVGGLAGWALGEYVPRYRWLAIALGFGGVLISVRPGSESFTPAALLSLYSALGYALGQLLSRKVAQTADPLVIANMQSVLYFAGSLVIGLVVTGLKLDASAMPSFAALTKPFLWPSTKDLAVMGLMGLFSCLSSVFFVRAYQAAPANFVAPLEYSAMVFAVTYGIVWFGDYPDFYTLLGAGVVIAAGLFMVAMERHAFRSSGRAGEEISDSPIALPD
ncbi:MAG: DMT family transporter [Alphaproteobacteria bacterium]|nr:DMT family transporter [Alphaproteobacteria bacterium]